MKKVELLAPAGNMESLYAAIEAGADAIYLGGKSFGARSFAGNFTDEELIEVVELSHLYGVKIYVTVNTIIYDNEVEEFLNYIDLLHRNNVDAVIMQDIGMVDLVHKTYPNLEIHASTQMHIHNQEGIDFLKELGIKRVVLARETNIEKIKDIVSSTNIDIEIFIHGALCISYSGQCQMSYLIGGRSGNRGSCAGTCRLPYDLITIEDNKQIKINKDKYLLSTKDLNTTNHIKQLIESGITSLKIEGRMKRPEYVYTVVSIYRKLIDAYYDNKEIKVSEEEIETLKKIFNRGFTKGFLFNEENNNITNSFRPNHIGVSIGKVEKYTSGKVYVKLTKNVNQGDGIRIIGSPDVGTILTQIMKDNKQVKSAYKADVISFKIDGNIKPNDDIVITTDKEDLETIQNKINEKKRRIKIDIKIIIHQNKTVKLQINDGHNLISVESKEIARKGEKISLTHEQISKQIDRFKDTVYQVNSLDIKLEPNSFVNIKSLNEVRRKGVEKLNEQRIYKKPYEKKEYKIDVPNFPKKENRNIKIANINQYNMIKDKDYNYIYVDDEKLYHDLKQDKKVIYTLSRVMDAYPILDNKVLIGEIGGLNKYKDFETDVSFNVTNSYSVAFLHSRNSKKITLSHELSYEQTKTLIDNYHNRYKKHPNLEVIVYGKEEAMISKFNLLKKYDINNGYLKDRLNNIYQIRIKDDKMIIYNTNTKNRCEDYFKLGINNIRYDLLEEKDFQ